MEASLSHESMGSSIRQETNPILRFIAATPSSSASASKPVSSGRDGPGSLPDLEQESLGNIDQGTEQVATESPSSESGSDSELDLPESPTHEIGAGDDSGRECEPQETGQNVDVDISSLSYHWGQDRSWPNSPAQHPLRSHPTVDIWRAGDESSSALSRQSSSAASSWLEDSPELLPAPNQHLSPSQASAGLENNPSPYPRPSWIPGTTPGLYAPPAPPDGTSPGPRDSDQSHTPEPHSPEPTDSRESDIQPPLPTLDYDLYRSHPIYDRATMSPSRLYRSHVRPVKISRLGTPTRDSPSPSPLIHTVWSRRSTDTPSPTGSPPSPYVSHWSTTSPVGSTPSPCTPRRPNNGHSQTSSPSFTSGPHPAQVSSMPSWCSPRSAAPEDSRVSSVSNGGEQEEEEEKERQSAHPCSPSDSDGYDTELEYDEAEFIQKYRPEKETEPEVGSRTYEQACAALHTAPQRYVIDHMVNCSLVLANRSLGPKAIKPLCKALMKNKRIRRLDISGNGLGEKGARYVAEAFKHNQFVSDLDLSHNEVGTGGALVLAEMLRFNGALHRLNLSYNNFTEEAGHYFAIGIEMNALLTELDLSHNELRENGAMFIGRALGEDSSLQRLNLSWNHIRLKGAVAICTGLRTNTALTELDISWNGFGYEGALGLASLLKYNTTLVEIDASHNRINWKGALLLARGLGNNTTLHTLRLGGNPLTTTGCNDIIDALAGNKQSALRLLDLEGIPVITEFEMVASTVRAERHLEILHGGIVSTHDVLGQRHDEVLDPLQRVINYMREKEIRPTELYSTFDKSKSDNHISDKEFAKRIHASLATTGINFQMFEMRQLLGQINAGGGDGENTKGKAIDYQKLSMSIKAKIELDRLKKIRERQEEKRIDNYNKDILRTKLPDIADGDEGAAILENAMTSRSLPGDRPPHPLLTKKTSVLSMSRPIGAKARAFGAASIKKKKKKKKKKK